MIRVALAKGFLFDEALRLFGKIGVKLPKRVSQRDLTFCDTKKQYEFLIVRPMDVPVYVEYGAAELGVVGKDILLEQEAAIAELADLSFGACDLIVAVAVKSGIKTLADLPPYSRVATKFPRQAERFFHQYGMTVELIKLYGSVELGPLLDLSKAIVDLTATGETLRRNGLKPIETILHSTARLIANPVFARTQPLVTSHLTQQLAAAVSRTR